MYTYSKRLTAQLLLFSFLLESCYNPHIGMGKKALPAPADPAYKQRQYAEEAYDKVNSNPTEQKQLLLCPDEDNSEQPGYVYVGKTPSQAKPNTQLLSIPAARQTAPPSQVGLAQSKQVRTSLQQAQEQPGPQAVLALTNPWQPTGGDRQLPTTPARARSKSLPIPSSESSSQQFVQNKFINAQQTSRKRTHSFKQQNKLQYSQRAAQAKRQRAAAVNEPAQPSPAITPLLPLVTQPPRLADKTPQRIASQDFLAQGGQHVRFMRQDGQWQASVSERPGGPFKELPVACQHHGDVEAALFALQAKPDKYVQRRIHVLPAAPPYLSMVYLGMQGLKGGGSEPSGSDDSQGEPSTGGHAGASGSGPSQPLAAPQDREASLADAFFDAIRDNDVAKVTDLLNQDSRLLEQTIARENGEGAMRERTPLMYAAQWGNQPMVSLLLEQGAQVDQVTKDGRTPLMIAAQEGHLEVAQYLVKQGAQVDQVTKDGRTPLYIAAQEGHLEVTQYLVEQGAQVDQVTKDGRTPLYIAAQEGHLEVAQYLVEHGA